MAEKRHAVILKGIKTGTEVTVGIFRDKHASDLFANKIKNISEEGGFTIGIYELESADKEKQHAVVLKGIKTGTEVSIGIFRDDHIANILANEIKKISEEGGFTIAIYELESMRDA